MAAIEKYHGKIKFGKVDTERNKNLFNRFNIESFPTIKVFDYGKSKKDNDTWVYKEQNNIEEMTKLCNQLIDDMPKDLIQITNQTSFDSKCKGSLICIISFLPNIYDTNAKERNSLLTIAKLATTKFAKKPFVHFWIQAGDQLDLERDLNLGFGFPAVIAIAPKKKLIGVL